MGYLSIAEEQYRIIHIKLKRMIHSTYPIRNGYSSKFGMVCIRRDACFPYFGGMNEWDNKVDVYPILHIEEEEK